MNIPLPYKFAERFRNSVLIESYVQRALALNGFTVILKPRRLRKVTEKINTFDDQIDLKIYVDDVFITDLEVKTKDNVKFESPEDFPFSDVYICKLEEGEEVNQLPFTIVSGVTGAILASLPSSKRFIGDAYDGERGTKYKVSKAPKSDLMNFDDLLEWLNKEYKKKTGV